ncbi:MAG: hypothetical protein J6B43_01560 [Lachnospiraceae bacterium]|nr:hypothetical protein [Lachnospiraceae bacterium]
MLIMVKVVQSQSQGSKEKQQSDGCQQLPPGELIMVSQGRLHGKDFSALYATDFVHHAGGAEGFRRAVSISIVSIKIFKIMLKHIDLKMEKALY